MVLSWTEDLPFLFPHALQTNKSVSAVERRKVHTRRHASEASKEALGGPNTASPGETCLHGKLIASIASIASLQTAVNPGHCEHVNTVWAAFRVGRSAASGTPRFLQRETRDQTESNCYPLQSRCSGSWKFIGINQAVSLCPAVALYFLVARDAGVDSWKRKKLINFIFESESGLRQSLSRWKIPFSSATILQKQKKWRMRK